MGYTLYFRYKQDLTSPVKYFNKEIEAEYQKSEAIEEYSQLEMVPEEFKEDYRALLFSEYANSYHKALAKSADKLCAYLKYLEEKRAGNPEFSTAKKRLEFSL